MFNREGIAVASCIVERLMAGSGSIFDQPRMGGSGF
jgi:hypothetical protein